MSVYTKLLASLHTLLYGNVCIACGEPISDVMHGMCTHCRYAIPETNYWKHASNPIMERLEGLMPFEHASALFFYAVESDWRKLIHSFKYGRSWHKAYSMGRWYGYALKESPYYADIDVIVPVPLHYKKIARRSYNQSQYIADGISKVMGVRVDGSAVCRVVNNPSQARLERDRRWNNVDSIFAVRHAERLRGKHILLVDDVLTTGATIISCANAIVRAVPDCRISVAVLAVTRHIIKG